MPEDNDYQEEQDEFNDNQEEFLKTYGYEHECQCAEDWETGNLAVVSMCYLGMCTEGMEKLREVRKELTECQAENAQLRIDHGGE